MKDNNEEGWRERKEEEGCLQRQRGHARRQRRRSWGCRDQCCRGQCWESNGALWPGSSGPQGSACSSTSIPHHQVWHQSLSSLETQGGGLGQSQHNNKEREGKREGGFRTLGEGGVLLLLDEGVLVLAGLGDEGTSRKHDLGPGKRAENEDDQEGQRKHRASHRKRSHLLGFSCLRVFLFLFC